VRTLIKKICILAVLSALLGVSAEIARAAEIIVHTPPPMVRAETIPVAPSPSHYWIPGHWAWEGGRYAWTGGHWTEARPGQVWIRARWVRAGNDWAFREGHWAAIAAPAGYVDVVTDTAPPVARVEVVGAPPSADHFWIPGYWNWNGHAHVWVGGRWERERADQSWVPGHWGRFGGRWHFYGGHWQRM
jgi:hypothetical protein